jgi:hypothetical protein
VALFGEVLETGGEAQVEEMGCGGPQDYLVPSQSLLYFFSTMKWRRSFSISSHGHDVLLKDMKLHKHGLSFLKPQVNISPSSLKCLFQVLVTAVRKVT